MKFLHKMACAAFAIAAAATAHAAQSRWTMTDLGNGFNPDFGAVFATSVNNRGEVSGWAYSGQNVPMHHAFVWENGTLADLGVPAGSFESSVYGLDTKGTYVGNSGNGFIAYYSDGAWTQLDVRGSANDVSDKGTIVGSYNSVGTHAFMLKDGVFTDLGTLANGNAVAYAVNHKDVVVGYSTGSSFEPRAFMYENGGMRDLGSLGGRDAYAFDINDHGVAVGAAADPAQHMRAVVYDKGAVVQLENVSASYSHALSINDHGDVVGVIDGHGFLLSRKGALTMLEQLPELAGWTFVRPVAINDRGWIVGQGWFNGSGRSFLLRPK